MNIPFVDLKSQYHSLEKEILARIAATLQSTQFILGPDVQEFEEAFAAYCECKYCVGVASGTDALHLALRACNIGPGDEVITVANTFIATVLAISYAGADPVLVDVDPHRLTIDLAFVKKAITPKTKAIIPVHLYGQPVDMDPLIDLAKQNNVLIIEDTCQGHGARYKGKRLGSFGDIACFSFYPGKNLGAYGDGGAITTNDTSLAEKMRLLRNYGSRKKYYHSSKGFNSRLDTIQAAVLNVKLKYLDNWNYARRKAAKRYNSLLNEFDLVLPGEANECEDVFHLYVIRCEQRDALLDHLNKKGINAGIHYPIPIHLLEAYRDLGLSKGDFPVAEKSAQTILSLPMFPEITEEQQSYVADSIGEFFSAKGI